VNVCKRTGLFNREKAAFWGGGAVGAGVRWIRDKKTMAKKRAGSGEPSPTETRVESELLVMSI
jgi:hypothetical protein